MSPTKVKELAQPTGATPACRPDRGGCCSMHRRKGRVYMDQLWAWSLAHPGERPLR
jgi:hypothetical protein